MALDISLDDDLICMAMVMAVRQPSELGDGILRRFLSFYTKLSDTEQIELRQKLGQISLAFAENSDN